MTFLFRPQDFEQCLSDPESYPTPETIASRANEVMGAYLEKVEILIKALETASNHRVTSADKNYLFAQCTGYQLLAENALASYREAVGEE